MGSRIHESLNKAQLDLRVYVVKFYSLTKELTAHLKVLDHGERAQWSLVLLNDIELGSQQALPGIG